MREWLKNARKEKGKTQDEVAAAAGIAQNSYCNIENGHRRPSPEVAKRIGNILGINWTSFFDE